MRVYCDVETGSIPKDDGRAVPGVRVTCNRCNHTVESFGTTERSVRRCFMLLKESCPKSESNYYLEREVVPSPAAYAAAHLEAPSPTPPPTAPPPATAAQVTAHVAAPAPITSVFADTGFADVDAPASTTAQGAAIPKIIQDNRFVILKTATTGLDIDNDEVVQVSLIEVDHVIAGWRSQVNVKPRVPITFGANSVHGLTNEILHFAPYFEMIACDLLARLSGRVVLGWNVLGFDIPILERQFRDPRVQAVMARAPVLPPGPTAVLDVRHLAARVLTKPYQGFGVVAEDLGVARPELRDSFDYARAVWQVFLSLVERSTELQGASIAEACEIARAGQTLRVMSSEARLG